MPPGDAAVGEGTVVPRGSAHPGVTGTALAEHSATPSAALQVPPHAPVPIDGHTIPLIPAKARTFPLC